MDGESKIVLRIRPKSYYRIELPYNSNEDQVKISELKSVLSTILQYETTPCPFKRGFTVDLPEPSPIPVYKRPWKPKARLEPSSEDVSKTSGVPRKSKEPSISSGFSIELDADRESDVNVTRRDSLGSSPALSSDFSTSVPTEEQSDSEATDDTWSSDRPASEELTVQDLLKEEPVSRTPIRPQTFKTGRTVTAPPKLSLGSLPSSSLDPDTQGAMKPNKESPSLSSSVDSFHSFHSPISPLSPSPGIFYHEPPNTAPSREVAVPRTRSHKRDVSEVTITADTNELWDMTSAPSSGESTYYSLPDAPDTPTLMSDVTSQEEDHSSEALTPSPTTEIRRRVIKARQRAHSPLPSPANLCSPYSPRSQISGHHLTTAILQRTCSLLLGPPAQLVALMLRIAAKLTKGASRGSSFGFGEYGQKIPCSWDFSDAGEESDDLDEDDFGVPISNPSLSRQSSSRELGGSWEID